MSSRGTYSPSRNEIMAIRNALLGWKDVDGLGPEYFAERSVERALYHFLTRGKPLSAAHRLSLSMGRARVENFYSLINTTLQVVAFRLPDCYLKETDGFLEQLAEQAAIWHKGTFANLDMSRDEQEIYWRVVAKTAPVLFNMGFIDAIPHSAQVSRLTASMAVHLGARHSEVLQAAIVGWLHDPKLHPSLDLKHENLATHPVNAAGLAWCVFQDAAVKRLLLGYFKGNRGRLDAFVDGAVDALGINNDSRFVQMMVVLPTYVDRIGKLYGPALASQFGAIIEDRLLSAAQGRKPRTLPDHLHGALSQIRLDSGLRGLSRHGIQKAFETAQMLARDPSRLIEDILDGKPGLSRAELTRLKVALQEYAVLAVDVDSTTLLHHHQEVMDCGRVAAEALVIADPMMLSPHKVAAVYKNAMIERIRSYVASFDDNNRLLPKGAQDSGLRWQRAVYLSMLQAADRLCGSDLMSGFRESHASTSLKVDVNDLRKIILDDATWCKYARVSSESDESAVQLCLKSLEDAYVDVVAQFRASVYQGSEKALAKFFPAG